MTPGATIGRTILARCIDTVRLEFGVTQEAIDQVAVEATMKDIGLTTDDYPTAMLRRSLMSRPLLFFWITTEGRVEGCRLLESAGYPEFDNIVCKRVEQSMRYEPARDSDGNPVRSARTLRIRFQIPT